MKAEIKNILIYSISEGVNKGIPLLLLPYVVSTMTKGDFADVSLYISVAYLFNILFTFAAESFISVKYFKTSKSKFNILLANNCIFVAATFFIAILIIGFLSCLQLIDYKFILIPVVSFSFLFSNIAFAIFRATRNAPKYLKYIIICTLLETFTLILLFELGYQGLESRLMTIFSGKLLVVLLLSYKFKNSLLRSAFNFKIKYTLDCIKFGLPLVPHQLTSWSISNIDKFIIVYYLDKANLAHYALAIQLSFVINVMGSIFDKTFFPFIFENIRIKNQKGMKNILRLFLLYCIFLGIIIIIGISAIDYVLNKYFSDYSSSAKVFKILLISNGIFLAKQNIDKILFYYERTALISKVTVISLVVKLTLAICFVNVYKIEGLAYFTLLSNLIMLFLLGYYSIKTHIVNLHETKSY